MSQFHPVLGCSNLGSMFQIRYIYGAISPGFILSKVSNVDPNSMLYCSHPLVLQVLSVTKNSSKIRHFFTISDFLLFIMNQFHGKYAYSNRIYIYIFFIQFNHTFILSAANNNNFAAAAPSNNNNNFAAAAPSNNNNNQNAEQKPYVSCPSAMKCVPRENCDFNGVMTDQVWLWGMFYVKNLFLGGMMYRKGY